MFTNDLQTHITFGNEKLGAAIRNLHTTPRPSPALCVCVCSRCWEVKKTCVKLEHTCLSENGIIKDPVPSLTLFFNDIVLLFSGIFSSSAVVFSLTSSMSVSLLYFESSRKAPMERLHTEAVLLAYSECSGGRTE